MSDVSCLVVLCCSVHPTTCAATGAQGRPLKQRTGLAGLQIGPPLQSLNPCKTHSDATLQTVHRLFATLSHRRLTAHLQEPLSLAERKKFPSPPLYRRESTISISLEDKSQPHVKCQFPKKSALEFIIVYSYCCGLVTLLNAFINAQTPVSRSGEQSPCDEVAPCATFLPQGQTFATPPTRHAVSCAHFQNIQSVSFIWSYALVLFSSANECLGREGHKAVIQVV